jgi:hypothetical protein
MNDQPSSDQADQSQRNDDRPPDVFAARITGTREALVKILQEFELDVGCRPHPKMNLDGTATLLVFASDERIAELRAAGYGVERGENVAAIGRERQADVGKGDRFEGGRVAPRGLGKKTDRDSRGGAAS